MSQSKMPARGYSLTPIGLAQTAWSRGNCPKNMAAARATGRQAVLVVDAPWRQGLVGIERASHLILLGWFGDASRDVLLQQPPHLSVAQGCFALRTPARPNPVGVSVARRVAVDHATGRITVDALDWYDGTALLDIKPYYATTDAYPDAEVSEP